MYKNRKYENATLLKEKIIENNKLLGLITIEDDCTNGFFNKLPELQTINDDYSQCLKIRHSRSNSNIYAKNLLEKVISNKINIITPRRKYSKENSST